MLGRRNVNLSATLAAFRTKPEASEPLPIFCSLR
jgi:hypothetical protein